MRGHYLLLLAFQMLMGLHGTHGPAAADELVGIHPDLVAPPDACQPFTFNFPVEQTTHSTTGGALANLQILRRPDLLQPGFLGHANAPVVLIVNGNSYDIEHYADYGMFLARMGFVVGIFHRSNQTDPEPALQALQLVFDETGLGGRSPVGLIGHSVGGGVAVAVATAPGAADFDIRAVAALAPQIGATIPRLTGEDAAAYLLVYGSQDEDVDGVTAGNPTVGAFAAYDRAGTEESTTCASPGACNPDADDSLERFLVYVHGLSHPGLVGLEECPGQSGACLADSDFLTLEDEFCLGRGYAHALMQWTLRGEARYRRVLTGEHVPASISAMRTDAPDFKSRPAGRRLTILHQWSPAQRLVINNFENWSTSQMFGATAALDGFVGVIEPGVLATDGPGFVRNDTHLLAFSWPSQPQFQWIGFQTPAEARDARSFTHVALRIGMLHAPPGDATEPPRSQTQAMWICLHSGNPPVTRCSEVEDALAPVDLRRPAPNDPDGPQAGVLAMRTVAIPISNFLGAVGDAPSLDPSNVEAVIIALPAGTFGTAAIDNLEWFRD